MSQVSAGLLVYRRGPAETEMLLAHPGGPYWRGRDSGAWSIPKGRLETDESPVAAALREFREETGLEPPRPEAALTPVRTAGGNVVRAWLAQGDLDTSAFRSNVFDLEWPPGAGLIVSVPEIDALRYFSGTEALVRIHASQRPLIVEALGLLQTDRCLKTLRSPSPRLNGADRLRIGP